jgi:hypothetical protein
VKPFGTGRPGQAYKPNPVSSPGCPVKDGDHSSRPFITERLKRPNPGNLAGNQCWDQPRHPCLVLLQVGFTKLSRSSGILVSSYLALSPLPF